MRADQGKIFIGRLPFGGDLLGSLTTVCRDQWAIVGDRGCVLRRSGILQTGRTGIHEMRQTGKRSRDRLLHGQHFPTMPALTAVQDGGPGVLSLEVYRQGIDAAGRIVPRNIQEPL